jgi:acyl-CoA thioesterase-1
VRGLMLACVLLAGAAAPLPCPPVSADAGSDIDDLAHLAGVLKAAAPPAGHKEANSRADLHAGQTVPAAKLEILAVGSATVFGPASGVGADVAHKSPGAPALQANQSGFPWQAVKAMEAAVPGLHADVTVIGKKGLSAAEMLPLLQQEVRRAPYQLVLWQTGTVDAVAEASPEDFYQTLAAGADAVGAAGADLVLIDPQYSRFLAANANLQPYLAAFQAAATLPGVGLFHRFDIMRDWVENGDIDLERAPKAERQATAVRLHACLGRELAKELLSGAQEE